MPRRVKKSFPLGAFQATPARLKAEITANMDPTMLSLLQEHLNEDIHSHQGLVQLPDGAAAAHVANWDFLGEEVIDLAPFLTGSFISDIFSPNNRTVETIIPKERFFPELNSTFIVTPDSGTAPLAVNFDAVVTGGKDTVTFKITPGDGSADITGSGRTISEAFTYNSAGAFTATLVVTDDRGKTITKQVGVGVDAAPPTPPAEKLFVTAFTGHRTMINGDFIAYEDMSGSVSSPQLKVYTISTDTSQDIAKKGFFSPYQITNGFVMYQNTLGEGVLFEIATGIKTILPTIGGHKAWISMGYSGQYFLAQGITPRRLALIKADAATTQTAKGPILDAFGSEVFSATIDGKTILVVMIDTTRTPPLRAVKCVAPTTLDDIFNGVNSFALTEITYRGVPFSGGFQFPRGFGLVLGPQVNEAGDFGFAHQNEKSAFLIGTPTDLNGDGDVIDAPIGLQNLTDGTVVYLSPTKILDLRDLFFGCIAGTDKAVMQALSALPPGNGGEMFYITPSDLTIKSSKVEGQGMSFDGSKVSFANIDNKLAYMDFDFVAE